MKQNSVQIAVRFEPSNGSCDCGEGTTIDLMVNTSGIETVMQAYIRFDPQCVNVTGVNYTGSPWQPVAPPGWKNMGDYVTTGSWNTDGVAPGVHKHVTLTLECVGCNCTTPLKITNTVTVEVLVYDRIFTCNASDERDEEPCLSTCYADPNCTEIVAENFSCCECIASGFWWHSNKDEACFGNNTPEDLCLDWCPECVDCDDNDGDNFTDYPMDPECSCGLDPSERVSLPPIPEMPTIVLGMVGILGIALIARKRK